jgi:hypothetical protein
MSDSLLVFAASYLNVLLLGLQSLNVHQRRFVGAAICSTLLGVSGFVVTSIIGDARGLTLSVLWWAFVLSGPAGIVTAMAIHPWLVKVFTRKQP